jgi:hypothetical protein
MSTQLRKEKFLWLWKRTGLVPPSELIQEPLRFKSFDEWIESESQRQNSNEPDLMTELLQKLIELDDTVAKIDDQAFDLGESLLGDETNDGEETSPVSIIRLGCYCLEGQLKTIYSIVGKLAAEQAVQS